MSDNPSCVICGTPLRADVPGGECPACLFGLGTEAEDQGTLAMAGSTYGGNYEVFEELGRGGMGVVHRARQISLNRMVALKKLAATGSAYPELAQRLRFEAEAAAGLNHPHIVRIYEVGEEDGQPFFSMELIQGQGLNRFIKRDGLALEHGPLPPDCKRQGPCAVAAYLTAKIARAADHAHKHGILHRDLKPANVIVDDSGEPYLTDFGLAKFLHPDQESASDPNTIKGTAAFMAPEQVTGPKEKMSTATDVYGLGTILYNMLTGHAPFRGNNPMEVMRKVVHDVPARPENRKSPVDDDLTTICMKCLEKEPKQRYPTALALAEDLERWLHHQPIEARPVGYFGRVWRWCHREPILASLVIGLFSFMTVSAFLTFVLYEREKANRFETEIRISFAKTQLLNRIERSWQDGALAVEISAEELHLFREESQPISFDDTGLRIGLAILAAERIPPDEIVVPYFALLDYLQSNLWHHVGVAATTDLRLYTTESGMLSEIPHDRVDFWCLDPAVYVLSRDRILPTNHVVVREIRIPDGFVTRGVIVTARDSGITNLAGLRGRSFAFGSIDSALGWHLPRSQLFDAGIRASDLVQITNLASGRVLTSVRNGLVDAGVVLKEDLEQLAEFGVSLRVLGNEIIAPNPIWILTSTMDDAIKDEVRKALIALKDPRILSFLNPALQGYASAKASDYDELLESIEFSKKFSRP